MGRYISQPLSIQCSTMEDVRNFLTRCKYVSDKELFGKRDYWQPPDEFEKRKAGDCEDFALWTWRQLLNMGYDARFIGGSAGRYGDGHAWVEYFHDGKCFLLGPLCCRVGYTIPRLLTLQYKPRFSVSWDGKTLRYFAHKKPQSLFMVYAYFADAGVCHFLGLALAQCASSFSENRVEHFTQEDIQTRTVGTAKEPRILGGQSAGL